MPVFDDKVMIEFLRRSYMAADGLWFVRVEAEHGYEEAMRIDEQVWDILPKIQARKARELLALQGNTLAELALCLELKFVSEGHEYRIVENSANRVVVEISECPWLATLRRSGREELAVDICDRICTREASVWASQFAIDTDCGSDDRMPDGGSVCRLIFTRRGGDTSTGNE